MSATKKTKAVPCGACGKGVFKPTNVKGQDFPHRDEPALLLSVDIMIPTCTACGEMRETSVHIQALDAALEPVYQARRAAMTAEFVERLVSAGWHQGEIEQVMGLSMGYLSKVLRGEKLLAGSTLRQLMHVALHPRQALRDLTPHDPQMRALQARLERRGALAAA